ncbi:MULTISPECIES: ABC transporter ATP-binding protein [unclassified Crossiella]|uniref:ABC transporter ATP-binding protein n=1 Tax=unclassified Crossiella TaxID=2620835 RepID=UPI001FFE59C7|nr:MULTISPECIES: ABC transporter ATP-binding protein [unclassified Crossiella]MCK2237448.1 ABC transporter ATP-binding protein [Crossiella sp. S99.2]MCK2251103.1 ABC transporter ATP-binding protein [Crossiella sp. S99.1]
MTDQQAPVLAEGLGKRYSRGWALRDCSLEIPPGRVVALVGPNGAGKSTLMGLVTGLVRPSVGRIGVFGEVPSGRGMHSSVSFLTQQKPLYPQFTVAETLRLGRHANPGWDQAYAEELVARAAVPLTAKVGTLSGGQRTRVALALALGKRPRLLMLDEPLADLDPLARQAVLQTLLAECRAQEITVLLSSHVLAELEGVCDHLVLLIGGRVRLAGDVAQLVHEHALLVGPPGQPCPVAPGSVIDTQVVNGAQLVLVPAHAARRQPGWQLHRPRLGHLALSYMRGTGLEVAA